MGSTAVGEGRGGEKAGGIAGGIREVGGDSVAEAEGMTLQKALENRGVRRCGARGEGSAERQKGRGGADVRPLGLVGLGAAASRGFPTDAIRETPRKLLGYLVILYASNRCTCGRSKLEFRWTCLRCLSKLEPRVRHRLVFACKEHVAAALEALGLNMKEIARLETGHRLGLPMLKEE